MKKITIIVPYLTGFGGTETVIKNLFDEYNKSSQNQYAINLLNIGGFQDFNWLRDIKTKKIIKLNSNKKIRTLQYAFLLPFIIFNQLKILKPDIVISTNPIMWSISYYFKKLFNHKLEVVSWYHYSLTKKPVQKRLMMKADRYLAISSGVAKELHEKYQILESQIKTIYNPVIRQAKSIRRSTDGEPCTFIYVGRVMLDGQKNLRAMIDALVQVKGDWQLKVFGTGKVAEVKTYVKSKSIESRVQFMGFSTNPWQQLDFADALLLTSKYEGFPMVLLESISYGIPVVSYNCPVGPSEIVTLENGCLVNSDDLSKLEETLQQFCNRNFTLNDIVKIKHSINNYYSTVFWSNFAKSLL